MKENSIEETIKIIERKIKEAERYSDITGLCLTLDEELRNALMNILSDYKRVLKENEGLKENIAQAWEEWNNLEQGSYETEQRLKKENEELREINNQLKTTKNEAIRRLILKRFQNKKIKDIMEDMQKEYNKLDEQVDEYINDIINKDLSEYYENKEKIATMQTLGWLIGTLQELIEK